MRLSQDRRSQVHESALAKPTLSTISVDALMRQPSCTLYVSNLIGLEVSRAFAFLLHQNALDNVLREQSDWLSYTMNEQVLK